MSYHYPSPVPRKRSGTGLRILLAVVLVIIAGFVACTASVGKAGSGAQAPHRLRYEVAGFGTASVTWISTGGGVSEQANAKLPWSADVTVSGFSFSTLTARLDQHGGDVTCTIKDDAGRTLTETRSSGPFASCSSNTPVTGSPVGSTPQT
jgi:hypothetical protein